MAITDSRWLGYVADRNENIFPVEKQIFFKNIIQFPQDPRVTPLSYFERLRISSFSVRNGNSGRRDRLKMPEFACAMGDFRAHWGVMVNAEALGHPSVF